MEKLLDLLSTKVGDAFEAAGYDRSLGRVTISNRPDLCEYTCNGAMAGAKQYHKAPFMIADAVALELNKAEGDARVFAKAESVKLGFLNLDLDPAFLSKYTDAMRRADKAARSTSHSPILPTRSWPNAATGRSSRRSRSQGLCVRVGSSSPRWRRGKAPPNIRCGNSAATAPTARPASPSIVGVF